MNWHPLKLSCINHFSYNDNKTYTFDFNSAQSICTFKLQLTDSCGFGIFDILVFAMYEIPLRSNHINYFVLDSDNYDGSAATHIEFIHANDIYKISRFIQKDFSVVSYYYILDNDSFVELTKPISTISSFDCAVMTSIMFSTRSNNHTELLSSNSSQFIDTLQIILDKSIDINSLQTQLDVLVKEFNELEFLTKLNINLQLSSDMKKIKCFVTENNITVEEIFPCKNILINFILYVILVYLSFGKFKGWFILSGNTPYKKLNYKQLHIAKIILDYLCPTHFNFVCILDNNDKILCNNFYNISVV